MEILLSLILAIGIGKEDTSLDIKPGSTEYNELAKIASDDKYRTLSEAEYRAAMEVEAQLYYENNMKR